MTLDLGARLGFLGAVLALFSIAAFYMWPDKKWIGWVSLVLAGGLLLAWGVTEAKEKIENQSVSFLVSVIGGCVMGGIIAAAIWKSYRDTSQLDSAAVQLSITCDNVALPLTYRGDLWILNTAMRVDGFNKLMAPPGKEALWPEEGVRGFGYRCTVKNHGAQAAFGVSFSLIVSKLALIRTGTAWTTGAPEETHTTTVQIPQPLDQLGGSPFSFYVCSYDLDGALDVTLPSTAFINSDDPKNKREVRVKVTSIAGNPFTVPPKNPFSNTSHRSLVPSVDLIFNYEPPNFLFTNRGTSNVYFWGAFYGKPPTTQQEEGLSNPVTINANGGTYHVDADDLGTRLKHADAPTLVDLRLPLLAYITMDDHIERVLKFQLWIHWKESTSSIVVDTQPLGVEVRRFTRQ